MHRNRTIKDFWVFFNVVYRNGKEKKVRILKPGTTGISAAKKAERYISTKWNGVVKIQLLNWEIDTNTPGIRV